MGSEGESESRKPHYNISMSRRTRKAESLNMEHKKSFEERESELKMRSENQKISLKQFMEGRCSLAQHFREEEKQQSVVVRPPDQHGSDERLRLKRSMMRNYAQLLSHLIKVKQESYIRSGSWRKSALSFKLIKHK